MPTTTSTTMPTTTPHPHLHRLATGLLTLAALAAFTAPAAAQAPTTPLPAAAASAAPTVGQPLPALALKDQHDQPWSPKADTRLVLFASGRKASNLVQAVLDKEPKDFLAQRHTVYLADMSKMPGFATRMFALPSLREMPFTVGVSLQEATLATWPRQPDSVTLIGLANGVVQGVTYATSEADLRAALAR